MTLNKSDLELIALAKEIVMKNNDLYEEKNNIVGSVIKCKSGNIYKGINIKTSHSICAEQVALGQAFACGEREIDTIVAVQLNCDGSAGVVSPCGLCRYTFNKLNIDANVIVEDIKNNEVKKVKIVDLLLYPYKNIK